jgi:predicted nucleic acid-binding protein
LLPNVGFRCQALLKRAIDAAGDQEAALSTIAVVELVHGIHRADTAERRARRESFNPRHFRRVPGLAVIQL